MDHASEENPSFLAIRKETISPKALSTLWVMALLDPTCIHKSLFKPLRQVFTNINKELNFGFPDTAIAHKEACAELVGASLLHFSQEDKAYAMIPEIRTSALVDLETAGLLATAFNGIVKLLSGLWPQMICVPDRTVGQEEFKVATAPGTNYEEYLKKRYIGSQLPMFQEFVQYAKLNVWGRRDELVDHVTRLEHIFYHLDDATIDICATIPFVMLLAEASWYYLERSNYNDAVVKIESALGVYELGKANSSLHLASIYRVHAAIASERGKPDEAARYVGMQVELLQLYDMPQGDALKERGLLDSAPDAISPSWDHDVPPGNFVVLPFRSICRFGFKLYLIAQDEKDQQYPLYLRYAETCFSAALRDCKDAHTKTSHFYSRIGELYYALGNVASKAVSFLGKAHVYTSIEHYENALLHFSTADVKRNQSAAARAETQYKLATQFMKIPDYGQATHHLDEAIRYYGSKPGYNHHLARLYFQRSRIQTLTAGSGARSLLHNAFAIRVALRPNDKRSAEELTEADFDELVGIWER